MLLLLETQKKSQSLTLQCNQQFSGLFVYLIKKMTQNTIHLNVSVNQTKYRCRLRNPKPCKWSSADGWRKGTIVGAQKDVIWRVFLEREVQ